MFSRTTILKFSTHYYFMWLPKTINNQRHASSVLLGMSAKGVKCSRYKNIVNSSDTFVKNSDGIKKDYRLKSALK